MDKFLAKHTSEDNASFERIMEESKLRIRDKFAWLFKAEGSQADKQNANLALPSCEEQAQKYLDDKPYNLDSWTYKSRNALMYVPKGVELSSVEIIEQKGKKEREIKHENTRFNADPFNSFACKAALTEAASVNANIKKQVGKVGVDGSLEAASVTPTAKGYGFVATPSPAPGWILFLIFDVKNYQCLMIRVKQDEFLPILQLLFLTKTLSKVSIFLCSRVLYLYVVMLSKISRDYD